MIIVCIMSSAGWTDEWCIWRRAGTRLKRPCCPYTFHGWQKRSMPRYAVPCRAVPCRATPRRSTMHASVPRRSAVLRYVTSRSDTRHRALLSYLLTRARSKGRSHRHRWGTWWYPRWRSAPRSGCPPPPRRRLSCGRKLGMGRLSCASV